MNLIFFQILKSFLLKSEKKNILKKDASYLEIAWHSKRQKKNIDKREIKKSGKKLNNNKYLFTFTFLCRKIFILLKKYIWKNIDFVDAVLWPKILDNKLGILMLVLIAMDYCFFFMFHRSTLNLEKEQKNLLGKVFGSLYSSNLVCLRQKFFKVYISQKHVPNLERNRKNSVRISVKNFANL